MAFITFKTPGSEIILKTLKGEKYSLVSQRLD